MRTRPILAPLLVFGLLVVHASSANAQEAKPAPTPADAKAGAPFDAATLDAALKGMRAFNTKMADAAPVSAEYADVQRQISALRAQDQRKIDDYASTRDGVSKCLRAFSASQSSNRTSQVQRKVMAISSDQSALEKFSVEYARLSQSLTAATTQKDSAEMQRINADITALLTLDAKADSIAGAKKCGVLPAKPDVIAQLDALQSKADGIARQLKGAESAADSAGARSAGVAPARFTQMRERLVLFVVHDAEFLDKEGDLLKARKADIEAIVKRP